MADKRKKVVSFKKETKEINKIQSLEKKIDKLEQENDLLKKWQRFLSESHQSDIDSSRETDNAE